MKGETVAHPLGTKTPQDSRTVVTHLLRHEDINGANRLFGGRLMEWIDDTAGITAMRHAGAEITTASVDTLEFRAPAFLDAIVVIDAHVTFVGKTSLEVHVDSYVEDRVTGERTLINKAYLTEVCVGDDGRPLVVPYGLALARAEEYAEWEAALFRKEVHKARRDSGI
jgi:acyl-CoA hydrolase